MLPAQLGNHYKCSPTLIVPKFQRNATFITEKKNVEKYFRSLNSKWRSNYLLPMSLLAISEMKVVRSFKVIKQDKFFMLFELCFIFNKNFDSLGICF